jgi:hypothetical protein
MDDLQAELLETQINRLKDNIESRFQRIEATISHHSTLEVEKQNQIKNDISTIRSCLTDHENRIRTIDDAVIANKTTTTLIQAGQAALTLIAASIAAWLGRK